MEIANVEEDEDMEDNEDEQEEVEQDPKTLFEKEKIKQFAQRGINNEDRIKLRLREIKANFYNRLESKKLIKKQGRVPFTEHMTISKDLLFNNEFI